MNITGFKVTRDALPLIDIKDTKLSSKRKERRS